MPEKQPPKDEQKEQLLRDRWIRDRWIGQEERIRKIIESIRSREDWTVHLDGLPFVDEIEPLKGEAFGRDLRGALLQGAPLYGVLLQGTDFSMADLREAKFRLTNLTDAKLCGADLRSAVFAEVGGLQGAVLKGAILRNADLHDTDLRGAKDLFAEQLAGTNVSNAKLPDDISEHLKTPVHVEEASKNARKIFLTMLLGCVYSWLTIATTTDVRLLTNSASSPLPIIRTEIPIVGFYLAAPLLLFGFYIYFHLCMQRLWEGLANLPAIFPDGRALDERIYPWLLTGLVRAHFEKLNNDRPAFSRLQEAISIFLAWCIVPLTMLFFWWRYLYRHGWYGTGLHVVLLGLSILVGFAFYRIAVRTLNGERLRNPHNDTTPAPDPDSAKGFRLKYRIQNVIGWLGRLMEELQRILEISRYTLIRRAEIYLALLLFLSFSAISGIPRVGSWARADFSEADVSTKPANWTGKEIALVKGAKLGEANLRYCLAESAFLVYADLRWADLTNADLQYVDLKNADLFEADLSNAYLSEADLRNAKLRNADLRKADLEYADLRKADLTGADLRNANLEGADLRNADLFDADLTDAILYGADLKGANLINADVWEADLRNANLADANLSMADLRAADLSNIYLGSGNLRSADLRGADFTNAKLWNADLTGADLRDTDLRNTIGLTEEQIKVAIIDERTKLPERLEHLIEEPLKAQKERESSSAEK